MSYSFIMTFKEISRSDLPAYILELMRFNREHVREILENNAAFIPSRRQRNGSAGQNQPEKKHA